MRKCVAIRHVAFEDLGTFGDALAEQGFTICYVEAGADDLSAIDPAGYDLVAVLGGPIGAYQDDHYPFLADELRLISARLESGRPLLGFCLGAQLMARALGARVYANPAGKEIGWSELSLTTAGRDSVLAGLAGVEVLHWHGDTFDLPRGADLLASTPQTPNQAFTWGAAALALQFHPEVTARGLERWFIGHAAEIAQTNGISVPELRAEAARAAPRLETAGHAMLSGWLRQVCPPQPASSAPAPSVP